MKRPGFLWNWMPFLAAALILTACASSPAAPSESQEENVINISFTTAWGSFNPYYSAASTMYEYALFDKIYDKLVFTDMAGMEILPRAALSWESADEGRTLIFHLDPGATWSDGEPVTAEDWVFTIRLLASPESVLTTRVFTPLLLGTDDTGAAPDPNLLGAEAIDSATLKLSFKEITDPVNFLVYYNRQFFVLPKHLLGDVPPPEILNADYWQNPVGSGPCVYVSQILGSEMVLKPNPYYHLWNGNWDKLRLRVLESSSLIANLISGEVDLNELGSGASADRVPLAELGGLVVRKAQVRDFFLEVLINAHNVPDPRIRKAMHLAIDKEAVVAAAAREVGQVTYGCQLPGSDYEDPSLAFPRDVEQAKALLTEAGYDGHSFTIAYAPKRENVVELLIQQWAEAGIRVNPTVVDVSAMFSGLGSGQYDLGVSGHSATVNPLWFETEFPADDEAPPDPVRDAWVGKIQTTVDPEAKTALVLDYQKYLAEQTYFIPLYFSGEFWLESPRVSGIRYSASPMCNDNVWEWVVNNESRW